MLTKAIAAGTVSVLLIALAVSVPAGTFHDARVWAFVALYAVFTAVTTAYLLRHDPALLGRRLRGPLSEPEPRQRALSTTLTVLGVATFVVSGLDLRNGGATVPLAASAAADLVAAVGLGIVFLTFRANSHTGSTVEVGPDQPVVDTGPYAVVRHPMYAGLLLLLAATPVALGSWWGLALFPALVATVVGRLALEERTLRLGLPGYAAYSDRVRYRLVPRVW